MKTFFGRFLILYFIFWAKLQLKKIKPTIIGITGSAGKTSTMHAVEAVLKDHRQVKASYKANSETGLPLDILGLHANKYTILEWLLLSFLAPWQFLTNNEKYQVYVAEMAIDSPFPPKNMQFLLNIFIPKIGIFLNAKPMHSLNFDPLVKSTDPLERKKEVTNLIAKEKGKLIEALPTSGLAILNADDENVVKLKEKTAAQSQLFGTSIGADLQVLKSHQTLAGTQYVFLSRGKTINVSLEGHLLPDNFAFSIAPALLVASYFEIDHDQALRSFKKHFKLPPGRSTLLSGINNSLILDSSYNASAQPTIDSLKLLKLSKGRKLALLGDIRELGHVAVTEHELVATEAAQICDQVFLVGPQMKEFALPILQMNKVPVQWFETAGQAGRYLKSVLEKDDMLLVKGSQNTLFLEIAVEMLMTHPEEAEKLLCRRGNFWDQQRKAYL